MKGVPYDLTEITVLFPDGKTERMLPESVIRDVFLWEINKLEIKPACTEEVCRRVAAILQVDLEDDPGA